MTIYTCLLPIVVLIVFVCHYTKHYPASGDCYCFSAPISIPIFTYLSELPYSLYIISVFISTFLIPLILLGILIHDNYIQSKPINKRNVNVGIITLGRLCDRFHHSLIGEIIHIFLYFVMLGIFPMVYFIWFVFLGGFPFAGIYIAECFLALMNFPEIVTYLVLLIVLYVLIRRLCEYLYRKSKKKS